LTTRPPWRTIPTGRPALIPAPFDGGAQRWLERLRGQWTADKGASTYPVDSASYKAW
jgi:hypothetical protein